VPGEAIPIASVPNLRDLGDWPTADGGRVRSGALYRSVDLFRLSDGDLAAFTDLGIHTIFDLRTEAERTAEPDRVLHGADEVVLDILKDSSNAAPAQLLKLLSDPAAAQAMLGDGKAAVLFERGYREIVTLPSALDGYRRFFTDIAQEPRRPALFHCTTGKDRTGWAAAATLLLLGVAQEDVEEEYLLTNTQLLPALQPLFDGFAEAGGDPDLLRPVLGVQPDYLDAALDEMRQRFGTIEGYFADGLGIDASGQDELRAALVEPA
jgi:protein-tyrosine phosphatase